MAEFEVFDESQAQRNEARGKCRSIGLAIGIGLGACFVLGTVMILGLLLRTVMEQATTANTSLSDAANSIQKISTTANDFAVDAKDAIRKLQLSIDQMAKDLDKIAKKIDGFPLEDRSVPESPPNRSVIRRTDR